MLNAAQQSEQLLRDSFLAKRPFPHLVIDNFLEDSFARKLLHFFPAFLEERAIAEHGRVGGKATRENVRELGECYLELDGWFRSVEFLSWMERVTGIQNLLFDPDYQGGGTHENLNGQDMSVHVDFNFHPKTGWHRRINALLYLNTEWDDSWGGALELWKNPWVAPSKNEIVKIAPTWNRLVIFPTTENSWHGFEKVAIPQDKLKTVPSRRSIAIYLYTKERPPHEIGLPHSTVYYERPLPESVKADSFLSKADYDEVARLTCRRDGLLETLYNREKNFLLTIANQEKNAIEQQERIEYLQQDKDMLRSHLERMEKLRIHHEEWVTRQKEYRTKLVRDGKAESDTLVIALHSNGKYLAIHGNWSELNLGFPASFEVSESDSPSVGDWILVRIANTECFRPVQVVSIKGEHLFCRQPNKPRDAFVVRSQVAALVKCVRNDRGEPITLPDQGSFSWKGAFLVRLFLGIHWVKGLVLRRVKSKWLWELSLVYRRLMVKLGAEVPVILPGKD
jgi:Rps23 Pro-64 3,4-dihydroxylase Tpa1-like proline 4-hydroxylase